MITKTELDNLVKKYETEDFIKSDPVQFIHKYSDKADIELAGFISSALSYGKREVFIKKLKELFGYVQAQGCESLCEYVKNGDFSDVLKNGFGYRFSKDFEIVEFLKALSKLYNTSRGLSELFEYGFGHDNDAVKMMSAAVDYFWGNANLTSGFCHLVPHPKNGGAMKRMNMFLRWMVRKSRVDKGIWDFIPKSGLLIPLDTHVARISREMDLLKRTSNDMLSVVELTNNLKQFEPEDPVKYDFAFFGKGIEG